MSLFLKLAPSQTVVAQLGRCGDSEGSAVAQLGRCGGSEGGVVAQW